MEIMVFYWTGAAIWWVVSLCTVCTFIFAACILPIILYRRAEKYFWQWKWAAIAATTGLTINDVEWAARVHPSTPRNVPLPEMLAWFESVKTRGAAVRKISSLGDES